MWFGSHLVDLLVKFRVHDGVDLVPVSSPTFHESNTALADRLDPAVYPGSRNDIYGFRLALDSD